MNYIKFKLYFIIKKSLERESKHYLNNLIIKHLNFYKTYDERVLIYLNPTYILSELLSTSSF
jgi:hypothetical protein